MQAFNADVIDVSSHSRLVQMEEVESEVLFVSRLDEAERDVSGSRLGDCGGLFRQQRGSPTRLD